MKFKLSNLINFILLLFLLLTILRIINLYLLQKNIKHISNKENYISEEQMIFQNIYDKNLWSNLSGPDSDPKNAIEYLKLLQQYFNLPQIKTIYDLGCGDWRLMEKIIIPENKQYIGFDVVPKIISTNENKFKKHNIHFKLISGFQEFSKEKGDLLIIKDVLQHLPNKEIHYFIEKIMPNFKYAIITNDYKNENSTYSLNQDINYGYARGLDLTIEPFYLKNTELLIEYNAHDTTMKRVLLYTNPNHK